MKRTFINIILISYVAAVSEDILDYVRDNISAGCYKYYSLMDEGPFVIQLMSDSGDADLYVSQTTTKPTYDPNHYCLQSSTCGEDIIHIPKSFKRPLSIGVYGHPSHEVSQYTLLVYSVAGIDEDISNYYKRQNISTENNFKGEKSTVIIRFLWEFISIFEDLLFQIFHITL